MRKLYSSLLATIKRRPYLSALIAIVLALRSALPLLIERVVETSAAETLGISIELDDVDLGLLRGLVAVDGLKLASPEAERDEAGHLSPDEVLVAWERFSLNLSWLGLLVGEVGLSDVRLVGPALHVVRNEDDSINLVQLFAASTEAEEADVEEDADEAGEPFRVQIDHIELQRGRLVFEDRTLEDAEPLVLEIGPLIVDGFAWPLPSQEHAADLALDVMLDGGVLGVRGHAAEVDGDMSITATLDAENLRMANVRGYAGMLGWVDLRGFVDIHVAYQSVGSQVHTVKGDVELRGFAVATPDHDRVPLLVEHLVLADADIDLVGQRVTLGELALDGGSLTVDPRYGPVLPVIIGVDPVSDAEREISDEARAATNGGEAADGAEQAAEGDDATDTHSEESAPWSWSLGKLAVADLVIQVLTETEPISLTLAVDAGDIDSTPGDIFPLAVGLVDHDATVDVEGRVRIDPPGASLALAWKSLDLARLATAVPLEDARMLRAGKTSGELRIGADLDPPSDDAATAPTNGGGDVLLAGRLSLDDFDLDLDPTVAAQASWRSIETDIASLLVPSVLGDDQARENAGPIVVQLSSLTIDQPRLNLVLDGAEAADAPADTSVDAAPELDSTVDTAVESEDLPAPVGIAIEKFELRDADLRIEERNVNTPFSGTITADEVKSTLITWPDVNAQGLQASGKIFEAGEWEIDGNIEDADGELGIKLAHIPLPPLSALSDDAVGLEIRRGTLSLDTNLQLAGDSFDSKNRLTAHDLNMFGEGAEKRFTANFGMPLSVVLALLKDPGGKITLDLPVSARRGQTGAGITTVIAAVLRESIVGAATSPLKLLGSVAVLGGKVTGFSLDPVAFAPGSSAIAPESAAELDGLASMVKSRPQLVLELRAVIVEADVRRVKEYALLAGFEAEAPLGAGVPEISWLARRRLRAHIESLKNGEDSTLDGDDETLLAAVLAARPIPATELSQLASARVAKLQAILRQAHGLTEAQLGVAEEIEAPAFPAGTPRVEFALAAGA